MTSYCVAELCDLCPEHNTDDSDEAACECHCHTYGVPN